MAPVKRTTRSRAAKPAVAPSISEPTKASSTNGLKWSAPPARRGRSSTHDWDALVKELKAHPGEWAELATWAGKGTASTTRTTLGKKYTDVSFTSRVVEEGSTLWGCFKPK